MIVAIMTTALSGTVWATSDLYVFNSLNWGDSSSEWTSGQGGNQFTSGRGVQVTTGKSGANATTNISFSNVSEVVVTYSTNTNSIYVKSVKITYTSGGDTPTPTTYTVTYDANGGTGTMTDANSPYEPGATVTVLDNAFTRAGYAFSGWNTAANGQGTDYDADDTFTISANTTLYAQWTAYTVTAQSNNDSYGDVDSEGFLIVAAPNTGYTYADPAYTVTSGSATVVQNGDEFTVTPSSDCTVTINFEALPTYTVTLGDDSSTLTEVTGGAGITLPSRSDVGIYTFAGWSATNVITETTTAPTIIPVGTYNPTADITLYPVYTKTEGGASIETSNVFESGSFANDIITWSIANVISIKQERNGSAHTAPNSSYVSSPRWYSGNLITITPNVSINSISVTTTSESYATALANSTFSNATASANGSAVTITPEDGSSTITITMGAQSRLSSLTVNYGGGTTYYYSTPVVKQENGILYVSEEYHNQDLSADGACELNLSGVVANYGTLQSEIVTESTTINPSNYTWENQVLNVSGLAKGVGGIVVIRFWVEEGPDYCGAEKIVTVHFRPKPVIDYDGAIKNTAFDTPYTIDTDLIEGGDITSVSSSNTAVATVDGLTITPVAVGSTTITINTAAVDDIWQAGTATFTLNVTAPEGKEKAATGDFVKVTSNGDLTDGEYLIVYEEGSVAFDGSRDVDHLDVSSNTIEVVLNNNKIAATSATEAATFTIDVTSGTIQSASGLYIGQTSDANGMVKSKETANTNTISIDNDGNANVVSSGGAYLRYNANSDQERFRYFKSSTYTAQKAIQLYKKSVADPISVKLNGSGYATFCSQYPLDFSDYETAGYSAWQITGVNGEKITFSQIKGSIKGGQGILLKGTANETITLTSADSETELSGNLLEGTLAPKYVAAEQYYGLSGNEFVKVNAGIVPAGKALLPASEVAGVKAFTFVFEDDATGIEEPLSNSPLKGENIYNLAGQMVNGKSVNGKLPKGIYIVNGKKIMVK